MIGNAPDFLDPDRPDTVRLEVADAAVLGERTLTRIGFPAEEARIITDQLIDNSLCGYRFAGVPLRLASGTDLRRPTASLHGQPSGIWRRFRRPNSHRLRQREQAQ